MDYAAEKRITVLFEGENIPKYHALKNLGDTLGMSIQKIALDLLTEIADQSVNNPEILKALKTYKEKN